MPRQDCNIAADDDIGNYSAAYAVPFGRGSDLQFLVFDSSWVGVTPIPPTDLMYRNYRTEFEQVFALGARTPRAFFMSHHPVLGFASQSRTIRRIPFPGNGGLQSVLTPMYRQRAVSAERRGAAVRTQPPARDREFLRRHPPQFITGNGGDWADQPFPVPFPMGAEPAPGAVIAETRDDDAIRLHDDGPRRGRVVDARLRLRRARR